MGKRVLELCTVGVLLSLTFVPFIGATKALIAHPDFPWELTKRDVESTVAESFTLRDYYIEYLSRAWYRLFTVVPSARLLPGRDGWFFRGRGKERVQGSIVRRYDNLADLAGLAPFKERAITHWKAVLERRKDFVEQWGGVYYFTVAPRKSVVYPEKLPPPLPLSHGPVRSDQLRQAVDAELPGLIIDLAPPLLEQKRREPETLLYLKTDGHWNIVGAFSAYQGIVDHVNAGRGPHLGQPLDRRAFHLRWKDGWTHRGFTNLMGFPISEPYPTLVQSVTRPLAKLCLAKGKTELSDLRAQSECDGSKVRLGRAGYPKTKWQTPGKEAETIGYVKNLGPAAIDRMVIVGDSFGAKLIPMLATHARETYYMRNVLGFPYEMIAELKPQLVLQEVAQGYLFSGLPESDTEQGVESASD